MFCMQVFTTAQGEWAPESILLTSAGLVQISMPPSGQISHCLGSDVLAKAPFHLVCFELRKEQGAISSCKTTIKVSCLLIVLSTLGQEYRDNTISVCFRVIIA